MKSLILTLSLVLGATAFADFSYDSNTGTTYNTFGNTTYAHNARTGSSWSQTTNGSTTYGTDSSGNTWNYNHQTGNYMNSNGKMCTGQGYARICN